MQIDTRYCRHGLQSSMPLPALWMEAEEANQGLASVRVSYTLGGKLQTRELPFKRVKVEAVGNDMQCPSSDIKYFAYISAKAHSKIYRIVNTLFPLLKSWEQEMDRSNIKILEAEASDKSRNGKGDHIRAVHFDRVSNSLMSLLCHPSFFFELVMFFFL